MPRYHFNVYDGRNDVDVDGHELPDIQAARAEALQLAGEIIRDDAQRAGLGREWRIEVTDDTGLLLFRMDFVVAESPAVRGDDRLGLMIEG